MSSSFTTQHDKKLATGKEKKEKGDKAFGAQDYLTALRFYHEALFCLKGLDSNTTDVVAGNSGDHSADVSPEKKEIIEIVEKVYSNMCACHIKQKKWHRAIETANKVLAKNADNLKARFRKGQALGEVGLYEKATEILEKLLSSGDEATVKAAEGQLQIVKVKERESTKKADAKMRGFLNKDKENTILGKDQPPQGTPTKEEKSTATS